MKNEKIAELTSQSEQLSSLLDEQRGLHELKVKEAKQLKASLDVANAENETLELKIAAAEARAQTEETRLKKEVKHTQCRAAQAKIGMVASKKYLANVHHIRSISRVIRAMQTECNRFHLRRYPVPISTACRIFYSLCRWKCHAQAAAVSAWRKKVLQDEILSNRGLQANWCATLLHAKGQFKWLEQQQV